MPTPENITHLESVNWEIEYEIPPLRAIYKAEGGPCTEKEIREQVAKEQPMWRIRKLTPHPQTA